MLVDAKGYLEHSPGLIRSLCWPPKREKFVIPLEQVVPKAEIHIAEVLTVEPKRVPTDFLPRCPDVVLTDSMTGAVEQFEGDQLRLLGCCLWVPLRLGGGEWHAVDQG